MALKSILRDFEFNRYKYTKKKEKLKWWRSRWVKSIYYILCIFIYA